jgi:hypothetical protein
MRCENIYKEGNGVEHVPPVPLAEPSPWWLDPEPVVVAPEPLESLTAPCLTCLSALGWKLPDSRVLCAECNDRPADAAKVVFVTGKGWSDYATERQQHERRHDEPDELPAWGDGIPWDASTPTCPKCGSAALWESLADKLHCLSCDPPRRAQRCAAKAALIRSRPQRRRFTASQRHEDEVQETISEH